MKTEVITTFTEQEKRAWRAYERVRLSGRFNMFDPKARAMAKLTQEQYSFCLNNYDALKEAVENKSNMMRKAHQ